VNINLSDTYVLSVCGGSVHEMDSVTQSDRRLMRILGNMAQDGLWTKMWAWYSQSLSASPM